MNIFKKFTDPTELDITKDKVWEKITEYIDEADLDNAQKWIDLFYKLDRLEYR